MLEVCFSSVFQNVSEIHGTPLMAAELEKYTAVFPSNLKFPGLFISPKCCHTVAFPFVLTTIINSLGATILDFVTRRLL